MRVLLLVTACVSGLLQSPPAASQTAPPGTDIYLVHVTGGLASMKNAKATAVSAVPGYDNQPNFSPDGSKILFAANRDGKQIDVFVFERANHRVTQLTQTAENENSPTYLPDGVGDTGGFSVVRTEPDKAQRLWRFDAQGRNPQVVLTDVKPVGYHAWIDAGRLALFVLGPPATLQIASVSGGKAETATEGIGRSLHRIPGTPLVSFVQRDASGDFWVKQIDPATKKIDVVVKGIAGSGNDRDLAWMPDGKTMLMSSGTKVFSWTRGDAGWTEVFDAAAQGLGTVSRLAVSPKGDAIAIVVSEPTK
jgi:Tol biopolymer transport system component